MEYFISVAPLLQVELGENRERDVKRILKKEREYIFSILYVYVFDRFNMYIKVYNKYLEIHVYISI